MAAAAGARVLLVDDLPEMRRLLELWLEETPVRVVGQAGRCDDVTDELIERHRPDVVVMDMNMPGPNGIECTRSILARHPRLTVVGFTSTDDPEMQRAMLDAGAVAHFHKSQLEDLVEWLRARAPRDA